MSVIDAVLNLQHAANTKVMMDSLALCDLIQEKRRIMSIAFPREVFT